LFTNKRRGTSADEEMVLKLFFLVVLIWTILHQDVLAFRNWGVKASKQQQDTPPNKLIQRKGAPDQQQQQRETGPSQYQLDIAILNRLEEYRSVYWSKRIYV
jgi:hypothetical protein